jgi:hypothetical protein
MRTQQRQVSCKAGQLPTVAFFGRSEPELTVVKLQVRPSHAVQFCDCAHLRMHVFLLLFVLPSPLGWVGGEKGRGAYPWEKSCATDFHTQSPPRKSTPPNDSPPWNVPTESLPPHAAKPSHH